MNKNQKNQWEIETATENIRWDHLQSHTSCAALWDPTHREGGIREERDTQNSINWKTLSKKCCLIHIKRSKNSQSFWKTPRLRLNVASAGWDGPALTFEEGPAEELFISLPNSFPPICRSIRNSRYKITSHYRKTMEIVYEKGTACAKHNRY